MKNIKKIPLIFSILSILAFFTPANAEIKVVASIKPIHSLASYLMDGIAKPDLIVDGYASPHGFAMKPSHAKMLQNADLIFWVGEDLENFLEKPLSSIAKKAEKIELIEIKGLQVLKFRERNIFDGHDHDDHGHDDHGKKEDDHDDHGHDDHGKKEDDHDDHGHDDHGKKEDDHDHDDHGKKEDDHDHDHDDHGKKEDDHDDHGHDDHDGHAHGEFDPHIWLDPINAKAMLNEMAEHLIENDPKNEAKYKSNLAKALQEIDKLTIDVMTDLSSSVSSIVFHDAYQYFEERFNVKVLGAFTVNTDVMPGAEQLAEIREIIEHDKVACVFSEPQFNPDIINAVAKDMKIKTGVLDPLGATLNPGKNLYFNLIRNMSASFKGC
ncbi:zinc ABC transporter substrate-binding protein [Candidatus Pelagibacter communis]|uniref:zinc ABC transporter substrate-binding protein n=1 Tax=Pelagibacter ubique TaxID=198252 RepID=UPI00092CF7AF|nr:zinc ABC transporter substrate-binding protein [Candidatus Pelagibacter ubique]